MQDLCKKMGEVEVYIKGWHVKEGMHMIDTLASVATPKAVVAPPKPANPVLQKISNNIRVSSTLFQWDPEMSTFTGKWDDVANHGIEPKLLENIIMTNPATGGYAVFERRTAVSFTAVVNKTALYLVMS